MDGHVDTASENGITIQLWGYLWGSSEPPSENLAFSASCWGPVAEREAIILTRLTRCNYSTSYRSLRVCTMQYTIQNKFASPAANGELEPTVTAAAR